MDKISAKHIIKETFKASFDVKRYRNFINELCNGFDESKSQNMKVPDAFAPHVKSCQRLGTFSSPEGELADVLIVFITETYKLERTRTALRDFVAHKLKRDESYKEAGLVAFVAPDCQSWRFSFVRMEYETKRDHKTGKIKPEERLTPARRYSYLVGADEQCHTAQTRFLDLLQNTTESPTLAQIEDAFSVESVTKEFFNEYARLFAITNGAMELLVKKDSNLRADFKEKNVSTVDFSKKLLGQIVFLYFIQKKGWLGVPKGGKWGDGPINFLRLLCNKAIADKKCLFNDVLEPLFYDTLATDRGQEAWCKIFQCRIPFLNGGLFEPLSGYDWKNTEIKLANSLFTNSEISSAGDEGTGILDIFDRYNFTVNEAEPLEKEVAIDPEMLGKVFENLIEENRRRGLGAFYTPREIVHYMCQESLINYLDITVNSKRRMLANDEGKPLGLFGGDIGNQESLVEKVHEKRIPHSDLVLLIRAGEQASHYEAARKDGTVSYTRKLPSSIEKNAQIIDEALKTITVCDPAIGSGAFPVGMMTEIVRARNSLTPYFNNVIERTPYHFKRHAIQSSIYGVDIDRGAVEIAKLRLWLSLVVDEEDVQHIKPLPNLDFKIVVGDSLLGVERNLFNVGLFGKLEELKPLFFDESDSKKKSKYKQDIEDIIQKLTNGKETFDFEIYFSEVFHKKEGFDVLIANPPYVSVEKFSGTPIQDIWKKNYKTFSSRGDIYCFFYEKGVSLLRMGGVLTFISSNKFQKSGYGKGLRQLLSAQRIKTLIDFCELPVFAASTDPMITIISKNSMQSDYEFPVLVVKNEAEFCSLPQSVTFRAVKYKPAQLKTEGWSLEGGNGLALVDKIRLKGIPLITYVKKRLYRGILTGFNEAFVIDSNTRKLLLMEDQSSQEIIKPWVRGKDIKRWHYTWSELYIILIPSSSNAKHPWAGKSEKIAFECFKMNYPAIAKYLHQYKDELKERTDKGNYFWELRSCDYWAEFLLPKIVFNETSKRLHAYLDTVGNIINKTGFIIHTPDAPYVLSILNSTMMDWLYRSTFPSWGDPWNSGRVQFRGNLMNNIPIPFAPPAIKAQLTKLAEKATKYASSGNKESVKAVEKEIDEIVYRLFDLTKDEISHIENALVNTLTNTADDTENDEED